MSLKGLSFGAQAVFLIGLVGILRWLRPDYASNVMGWFARLIGPCLPMSKVAKRNIARVFPDLDEAARRSILLGMWDNLGRNLGEFPHLCRLSKNSICGPGWEIEGEAHLMHAASCLRPIIFISGHIGNWEMLPLAIANYGVGFASFYRAPNNPYVSSWLYRWRKQALPMTLPLFNKGKAGARKALQYLSEGGNLGFLVDQKMNGGILLQFFGLPAMTASAAAAMALKYQCPIVMGYVRRLGPARLRIIVEKPIHFSAGADRNKDISELTQFFNDRLEDWIRQVPSSWLWVHRRWVN